MLRFISCLLASLLLYCSSPKKTAQGPVTKPEKGSAPVVQKGSGRTDTLLENILKIYPRYFGGILDNRDSFRVQIIYTQIDRRADNSPVFKDYYFNLNPDNYFYPASTVKMPTALLALQKLNELKINGLDKYSTMITEAGTDIQTPVYNDPLTPDGLPSVAHYVRKIFLVSDNDAFNRLYEFVGQEYLNEQLRRKGFSDVEIIHRLDVFLTQSQNRQTKSIKVLERTGNVIYDQPMQTSKLERLKRNEFLGRGFMRGDQVVSEAFDFS